MGNYNSKMIKDQFFTFAESPFFWRKAIKIYAGKKYKGSYKMKNTVNIGILAPLQTGLHWKYLL